MEPQPKPQPTPQEEPTLNSLLLEDHSLASYEDRILPGKLDTEDAFAAFLDAVEALDPGRDQRMHWDLLLPKLFTLTHLEDELYKDTRRLLLSALACVISVFLTLAQLPFESSSSMYISEESLTVLAVAIFGLVSTISLYEKKHHQDLFEETIKDCELLWEKMGCGRSNFHWLRISHKIEQINRYRALVPLRGKRWYDKQGKEKPESIAFHTEKSKR